MIGFIFAAYRPEISKPVLPIQVHEIDVEFQDPYKMKLQ